VEDVGTAEGVSVSALAGARRAVYQFLLAALDRPSPGQHAWMSGPEFLPALAGLCDSFGLGPPPGPAVPEEFGDHESRYLACFEVGLPGPPVALLASHYQRREPAPTVIHEHVLLYRRFGVRVPADGRGPADHLLNQLAFLIRLDDLLLGGGQEAESLHRARHDFLSRHLARWVGRAAAGAEEKRLPAVYCVLLALLTAAVGQDRELTGRSLAALPQERT
jgi:hypothetical protein